MSVFAKLLIDFSIQDRGWKYFAETHLFYVLRYCFLILFPKFLCQNRGKRRPQRSQGRLKIWEKAKEQAEQNVKGLRDNF